MIGSGAGAQRTGVKRKAEDQTQHKRTPGFPPSLQSSASPPHTSFTSLTPAASSSQLAGPSASGSGSRSSKGPSSHLDMEIESLLNQQSTKEQQSKKVRRMRVLMTNIFYRLSQNKCETAKIRCLITDGVNVIYALGEQRNSGAAQCQHSQGAVHCGKVPVSRPSSGPRVLRPRDQRGLCTLWGHTSAVHQVTLPVSMV